MQIQTGTCSVTNGSATVIASAGNDWSAAAPNSLFSVPSPGTTGVLYTIAAVTTPGASGSGRWELSLSAPYAGLSSDGVAYEIAKDFTPNYSLPLLFFGDTDTAALISRALSLIDSQLGYQGTLISQLLPPGPVTLAAHELPLQPNRQYLVTADFSAVAHFADDRYQVRVTCDDATAIVTLEENQKTDRKISFLVFCRDEIPSYETAAVTFNVTMIGKGWTGAGRTDIAAVWNADAIPSGLNGVKFPPNGGYQLGDDGNLYLYNKTLDVWEAVGISGTSGNEKIDFYPAP